MTVSSYFIFKQKQTKETYNTKGQIDFFKKTEFDKRTQEAWKTCKY